MSVFKIQIAATPQHVWEVMLQQETYKQWVAAAWPPSFYKGQWEQGSTISFVGDDGSGTLALIETCKPYQFIAARHIAVLLPGGVEDSTSEEAKKWIGTTETYTFTPNDKITEVMVDMAVHTDYEKMFITTWPKALQKLKELCEAV